MPFQQTIDRTTDFQRDVYYVALVAAAVATALLIAPAAQHRVLFRQHDKEALLRRSNRSAFAGLVVLAVAMRRRSCSWSTSCSPGRWPGSTAGVVAALLLWWWVAVPFWQRAHDRQDESEDD